MKFSPLLSMSFCMIYSSLPLHSAQPSQCLPATQETNYALLLGKQKESLEKQIEYLNHAIALHQKSPKSQSDQNLTRMQQGITARKKHIDKIVFKQPSLGGKCT